MSKVDKKNEAPEVNKKKGFWKGLIEKIDKKMIDKANQSSCCGTDTKGGKCC